MNVYKNCQGRLGNQMFQYASSMGILKNQNIDEKIKMCFKDVYKMNFTNELQNFNLKHYEEVPKISLTPIQKCLLFYIKINETIMRVFSSNLTEFEKKRNRFDKRNANFLQKFGIYRIVDGYYEFKKIDNKNIFFSGSFESDKFFKNIRQDILEEFTPKFDRRECNKKLYDIIEKTNSVCVSIRRGDFLNAENKDKHFVCDKNYFKKAINEMNKYIDNPKYIIFSDDIKWCKENISFIEGAEFESGTDPVWEKLRLMYTCKNFIISNSTFSWWAQYLSRNENKIVIAPNKWKNIGTYEDIYQDNWILVDTN